MHEHNVAVAFARRKKLEIEELDNFLIWTSVSFELRNVLPSYTTAYAKDDRDTSNPATGYSPCSSPSRS
jgi:hypothetical protein